MKKPCFICTPGMKNFALLVLRLAVGAIFIYHGYGKLQGIEGVSSFFTSAGIPLATFFAYVVALVELLGGIAVVLGVFTKMAAALLAIVMLVALLTVHLGGTFAEAELPIALLGATLGLVAVGAGDWKVYGDCACCKE